MGFYLKSKEKKDCYSCNACISACPKKCIRMIKDKKSGYYYPKIDKSKCIRCGKCKKICINNNPDELKEEIKKSFILFRKSEEKRKTSASGGISSLLMEYVINQNGIVYGVKYDKNINVIHSRATTLEECENFKTSKYLKRYNINIYKEVLKDLENNKIVLFTGIPCEIASMKRIIPLNLQKKLILCEIMCDSTASPLLFKKLKKEIETKYNSKITKMNFRSKEIKNSKRTMKICLENGKELLLSSKKNNLYAKYMFIFGNGLSAPYSCQYCKFEDIDKRIADLTLGDYNGNKKFFKNIKDKSILLISTKKGIEIFNNAIKEKVNYLEVKPLEALEKNHIKPKKNIFHKNEFMEDLYKYDFNELSKKYIEKYKYRRIIGKIFPKNIKEYIKERLCNYDK